MNKIVSSALLTLISICVVSCSKQEMAEGEVGGRKYIEMVFTGGATKTVLDGKSVLWQPGDALSVWDGVVNCHFTTSGSGESAIFSGQAADAESYFVLYPYSPMTEFVNAMAKTTLPSDQKACLSTFDPSANIAFGISSKNADGRHSAHLKNVGAYFKFTVGSSASGLKKVTLKARGGEFISGVIKIGMDQEGNPATKSFTTETLVEADEEGSDFVNIVPQSGNFAAGTYYLVFRPTVLSDGLRLTLTFADNSSFSRNLGLSEAKRNIVYTVSGNIDEKNFEFITEGMLEEVIPYGVTSEGMTGHNTAWNTWTDAASLKATLLKAADNNKTYFSNFRYYDFLSGDTADSPYGHPHLYSMDFYEATGNYLPRSETRPVRQNLIEIVKRCWKRNKAVCLFSWHLESPYAVYDDFKLKLGCRYCYGNSILEKQGVTYPEDLHYVVKDILNNRKVDTNGITYLGDWFDERVQEVADIINELVDENGKPIPIIFRLWHEQGDSWSWWQCGSPNEVSLSDYKKFFRLTVDKIREKCPNAEILWAYGPNRKDATYLDYLQFYPGDDYVDIMGYDDYWIGYTSKSAYNGDDKACYDAALEKARVVSFYASRFGKVAAIFETDNEDEATLSRYYSDFVQPMLQDSRVSISIFQMWTSIFKSEERRNAFNEFKTQDNIIFDH